MSLHLYNTLSKRKEAFAPADPARVTFYSCGPTVYDYAHIGNFRSFLVADLARRWIASPLCEIAGQPGPREVVHVMNITDVGHMTDDAAADGGGEDKMDAAAARMLEAKKSGTLPAGATGVDASDPHAIADFYTAAFLEDARTLGLQVAEEHASDARVMPRATEHVRAMLEVVVDLIEKGAAYQAGAAVYFRTSRFPEYGALSGNTLEKLRAGAGGRVDDANQSAKEHPADFLLWKADATHKMKWDPDALLGRETGLGEGYPGWHIECSAMSLEAFRAILDDESIDTIDLHSGGEDNIFPHHECEIAQSRAHTGADVFARSWLHTRHLMVEGEKMSKSTGNFFTIRDLLGKGFEPAAIRLELLKTHYRSNANFTEQGLKDSQRMVNKMRSQAWYLMKNQNVPVSISKPEWARAEVERAKDQFSSAMDGDLNVSGALAALTRLQLPTAPMALDRNPLPEKPHSYAECDALYNAGANEITGALYLSLYHALDNVLGVIFTPANTHNANQNDDAAIDALVKQRDAARASKDWAESDRIRDELAAKGIAIKDGKDGATWERTARL